MDTISYDGVSDLSEGERGCDEYGVGDVCGVCGVGQVRWRGSGGVCGVGQVRWCVAWVR